MVSRWRKARQRLAKTLATHLIRPDQQPHQLRAISRKMRVCSAAGNYVASEIGTFRRTIPYVAYFGLRYAVVGWFNSQRDTGTRERDFP